MRTIKKAFFLMMFTLLMTGAHHAYGSETWLLKEIIASEPEKQAILESPDRQEVTVQEGDILSNGFGTVDKIEEKSITIKQPRSDGTGSVYYRMQLTSQPQPERIGQ